MNRAFFRAYYADPRNAECCAGYVAGCNPCSPEPNSREHPIFVQGFLRARQERGMAPPVSDQEMSARADYLWAVFADEVGQ